MGKRYSFLILWGMLLISGCTATSTNYIVAPAGSIPDNMLAPDIRQTRHFTRLIRTAERGGLEHERVKIQYLIDCTRESGYTFDRNGYVYDARKTSDHLIKKYRQRFDKIKTARDFIDHVASISSASDRAYYALPGDGLAYQTGDLLNYELKRLEDFIQREKTRLT